MIDARETDRQVEALVAEIYRYLETVETFRAQGSEPSWQAESSAGAVASRVRVTARKRRGSSKPREGR